MNKTQNIFQIGVTWLLALLLAVYKYSNYKNANSKSAEQNDVASTQTSAKPCMPDPEICPIQQRPLPCERRRSSLKLDSYNIKIHNSEENEQITEFLLTTPIKAVTLKSEPFSKPQQDQFQQTNGNVAKTSGRNKRRAHQNIDDMFLIKQSRHAIGMNCNSELLDLPLKSELVFMDETVQETTYDNSITPENASNKIRKNVDKYSFEKIAKQDDIINNSNLEVLSQESNIAVYSATSRGRVQLIYGGQPFIFEKNLKLPGGEEKKYWRCNQWWNQKCRSRVFTINDTVVPLNRYHTHEEIVKRKKRVRKIAQSTIPEKSCSTPGKKSSIVTNAPTTIDVTEMSMHLKYEEIVADVTEMVVPTDPLSKDDKK